MTEVTEKMVEAFYKAYDASHEMQPREHNQAVYDGLVAALSASPAQPVAWLPIAQADRTITEVQDFSEVGVTLRNSDRYWVRDEDGRVYEAVWTDDKAGYWWDLEGESPVDPVEFMPHPLDPRFPALSAPVVSHPRDSSLVECQEAADSEGKVAGGEPEGWRTMETAPKNTKVLAAYQNELGNWRIVTACYHTQLDWSDEYGDHEEEFAPEAWYEENDSSEVIYPTSRPPTHWQPLPAAPSATLKEEAGE